MMFFKIDKLLQRKRVYKIHINPNQLHRTYAKYKVISPIKTLLRILD